MDSASSSGMHYVRRPKLPSILAVLPLLFIFFADTVVMYTVYPHRKDSMSIRSPYTQVLIGAAKFTGSLDVVHGGDRYNRKPVAGLSRCARKLRHIYLTRHTFQCHNFGVP